MKIPFDIKFKPQIENGEYRVETKAGCPVRIVCWDMACELPILGLILLNDEKVEEMAVGFTNEGANLLGEPLYDSLFIVTPEPEPSEFEKACMKLYNEGRDDGLSGDKLSNESLKESASELLALAKKEIGTTFDKAGEYLRGRNDGIEYGKAEVLNDLPRWKKCQEDAPCACIYNCAKREDSLLYYNGHTLKLIDLEKLPGFNE